MLAPSAPDIVQMERAHIQGMLDIYKLLKQNAALIMNHRYGPDYLLPS